MSDDVNCPGSAKSKEYGAMWYCHMCENGPYMFTHSMICVYCYHTLCDGCAIQSAHQSFLHAARLSEAVDESPIERWNSPRLSTHPSDETTEKHVEGIKMIEEEQFEGSVASLESTASTLFDPNYSPEYISSAEDNLVQLFSHESELESIYKPAIGQVNVSDGLFLYAFRRQLRLYSIDLRNEAENKAERQTASFIRSRASEIARRVGYCFGLGNVRSGTIPWESKEDESTLGDPKSGAKIWEPDLPEFRELQLFLKQGSAFSNLLTRLQDSLTVAEKADAQVEVAFPAQEDGKVFQTILLKTYNDYRSLVPHLFSRSQFIRGDGVGTNMVERRAERLRATLTSFGLLFPAVQPGYQRIRWNCPCGVQDFDDYKELSPGSMENFRVAHTEPHTSPRTSTFASEGLYRAAHKALRQLLDSLPTKRGRIASSAETLPTVDAAACNCAVPPARELYLLICIDEGECGVRLEHERLGSASCDFDLYKTLKRAYEQHRSLKSWLTLRTLRAIKLTKFVVDMSKRASVMPHELHCGQTCYCLPPKERIEPNPGADYRCSPAKPGRDPPIGSNELMHYVQYPHHVSKAQRKNYNQVPKRISGELIDTQDTGVTGWGLHFQDGLAVRNFWLLVGVVFLMGGLLFGILWKALEHDLQTAFTVAAWITTTGQMIIGGVVVRYL